MDKPVPLGIIGQVAHRRYSGLKVLVGQFQEYVDSRFNVSWRLYPGHSTDMEKGQPQSIAELFYQDPQRDERPHSPHDVCEKKYADGLQEGKLVLAPSTSGSSGTEDVIYVDWEDGDPLNPTNYSWRRKWLITLIACSLSGLSGAATSTFAMGFSPMEHDLNSTQFQATIALAIYALGFAVAPLLLAPLSEEFGRRPMYIFSTFVVLMVHIGTALSQNIQSVIVLRFIAGAAGSAGSTMVGGTIADIWAPHERGIPMGIFTTAAIGSFGLGPTAAGWIALNPKLQWRWIQWLHAIFTGMAFFAVLFGMKETRSAVLLTRSARALRRFTGDKRYRTRAEDERPSMSTMVFVSCTRPIHLLLTEPVVMSLSVWFGFTWGTVFALVESISPAFEQLHHFNIGEVGTAFITLFIGSVLGCLTNIFIQERIYAKKFPIKHHEARLYTTCVAAVVFPIAMFIYAGTSQTQVHWIGMCIAIIVFMWSAFTIYLAVFAYLADCYGPFASSAMAGQSLFRNLCGFAFPLFTDQMYTALTFKWANFLFGCIALIMAPIPLILFKWGPQIRARSKFASQVPSFGS